MFNSLKDVKVKPTRLKKYEEFLTKHVANNKELEKELVEKIKSKVLPYIIILNENDKSNNINSVIYMNTNEEWEKELYKKDDNLFFSNFTEYPTINNIIKTKQKEHNLANNIYLNIDTNYLYSFVHEASYPIYKNNTNYKRIFDYKKVITPMYISDDVLIFTAYKVSGFIEEKYLQLPNMIKPEMIKIKIKPSEAYIYSKKHFLRLYSFNNQKLYSNKNIPNYIANNLRFRRTFDRSIFFNLSNNKNLVNTKNYIIKELIDIINNNNTINIDTLQYNDTISKHPYLYIKEQNDIFLSNGFYFYFAELIKNTAKEDKINSKNSVKNNKDIIQNIQNNIINKYVITYALHKDDKLLLYCDQCQKQHHIKNDRELISCSCGRKFFYDSMNYIVSPSKYVFNNDNIEFLIHKNIDHINNKDELLKIDLDPYKLMHPDNRHNIFTSHMSIENMLFFVNDIVNNEMISKIFKANIIFDPKNYANIKVDVKLFGVSYKNKYYIYNKILNKYKKETPTTISENLKTFKDFICVNPKKTKEIFHNYIDKYNVHDYFAEMMNIEKNSMEYYAALCLWEGNFATYFINYPKIELLIKSQYKQIAKDLFNNPISRREINRIFDFSQTKPKDVCNLNKIKLNFNINNNFLNLKNIQNINYIKYIADFNNIEIGIISKETIRAINNMSLYINELRTTTKNVANILKDNYDINIEAKNIIEYVIRAHEAQAINILDVFMYWEDYLFMASNLNYNLNDKEILYPDSLKREHDIAAKLTNEIEYSNIDNNKTFKKIVNTDEYKFYEYDNKNSNYIIIRPKTSKDLINEGIQLNHCVASYVSKVSNKDSKIYFLRNKENINESYYTIEIQEDYIIQIRGAHNVPLSQAPIFVKNFIKEWANIKKLNL